MCASGMEQEDEGEMGGARERTRFMTNSGRIADRLERSCSGDHEHIVLEGGTGRGWLRFTQTSFARRD